MLNTGGKQISEEIKTQIFEALSRLEELNDAITKSPEAKYGKPQATPENPADFVVTEEIYQDALKDWDKYRIVQKIMIRDYAKANDRFIPGFWTNI